MLALMCCTEPPHFSDSTPSAALVTNLLFHPRMHLESIHTQNAWMKCQSAAPAAFVAAARTCIVGATSGQLACFPSTPFVQLRLSQPSLLICV
jgi:hypothetical protein